MAALRKLPYLPLYVQDFTGDERLTGCSPAAVGVYIFLLCFLHKSETYGKLVLRPKDRLTETEISELKKLIESKTESKTESKIIPFAKRLQRNMPFELHEIATGLSELAEERVITIDGEELYQRRMVKDGEISEKRSINGTLGGRPTKAYEPSKSKTKSKVESKNESKNKANTEYENEYENNNIIDSEERDAGEETPAPGRGKAKTFTPPTVEEVEAYCRERENGIDGQEFVDFYTTNGWVQGKQGKPIKDWKACVRTWERNGIAPRNNYGTGTAATGGNATGRPSTVQGDTTEPRTRRSTI